MTWDAFEAVQGLPFTSLAGEGKRVPWATLRHWLHDLAAELWAATGDETLPAELSLDHIWITAEGCAILLDEPWPDVRPPPNAFLSGTSPASSVFWVPSPRVWNQPVCLFTQEGCYRT